MRYETLLQRVRLLLVRTALHHLNRFTSDSPLDDGGQTQTQVRAGEQGDGRILLNALDQDPSFYKGGWLLDAQSDAEAITFGNSTG
jgi:hypothetical protein